MIVDLDLAAERKLDRNLELLADELQRALRGLDDRATQLHPKAQLQDRPAAKWNIQQVTRHLVLTYGATVAAVDARIARGTPTKARPSMPQLLGQLFVIQMGRFPKGRTAPAPVSPTAVEAPLCGDSLGAIAAASIARMDDRLQVGDMAFGPRQRAISHMVLGPLSVRQWRRFHLVHGRHHLKQIMAIRSEYGL